jgi:acetolactate synthase I/II/III large subunit
MVVPSGNSHSLRDPTSSEVRAESGRAFVRAPPLAVVTRDLAPSMAAVEGEMSVAHAILDILEGEGVEYIFGVPGGPLTGLFEAMHERKSIRLVLAKHEAGAAYMAAAHARVSRKLAVCCGTSGPGATNALTGIASAYTESLPVLLLTGQVATFVFGKGAIQESSVHGVDVVELFRPVTKLSAMLPHVGRGPDLVRTAIRTAMSGRRGPVHLSLPADLIARPVGYARLKPEQYRPVESRPVDRDAIRRAAKLLAEARRPCFLAGHGVALSNASEELTRLARTLGAAVVTSPKGKGVFPEDDPLSLGVLGFGGHERGEKYVESGDIDVLVIVGSSMNEFVTNAWTLQPRPRTALIQIDVDAASIAKNYPVDLAIVGDARASLQALGAAISRQPRRASEPLGAFPSSQAAPVPRVAEPPDDDHEPLKPQKVVLALRDAMPEDAMLFVDTGNSILWATHYFQVRRPDTYFIDLGLGAMGSAVAGVVGGAMASPRRRAVALVGDAAFAMHGCEVHTAVEGKLPIVWVVLNNGGHGMVHQGDTLMKGKDLGVALFRVPIDIAAMSRAVGARAESVDTISQFRRAIDEALAFDGPTVIDARIDPHEMAPTLERRVEALARFLSAQRERSAPVRARP